MKKRFTKIIAIAIAVLTIFTMTFATVGCGGTGGGGTTSTKTEISLKLFLGTATHDEGWIEQLEENFEKANKDVSFETGKKGVKVTHMITSAIPTENIRQDGYDIYMTEINPDIYGYAGSNQILDISSVVNKYIDNINPDVVGRMIAADGNYYAMPYYAYYAGIPYDVTLIESKNAYFANETTSNSFTSSIFSNTYYFVENKDGTKACGADGEFNTVDDGLPSSLEELMVWCEYLKSLGVSPFIMGTSQSNYSFYLTHAIWASLAGYDAMKAVYTNYAQGGTDAEVVTGFSTTEFFYDKDNLKIPMATTEKVKLTKDNGYKAFAMSARYYSLAFLQVALKEGWFDYSSVANSTEAQTAFMTQMIGDKATLLDASYWYHESVWQEDLALWESMNPELADEGRNVSFMTMPSQMYDTVTEGNGKQNTILNLGNSYTYVNGRLGDAGNEGKKDAVLKFLEYMYSDEGLKIFTDSTGLTIPMDYNYTVSSDAQSRYYRNEKAVVDSAKVVHFSSDNVYFKKNAPAFSLGYGSSMIIYTDKKGVLTYNGYIDSMRLNSQTAQDIFEVTIKTAEQWAEIIK